MTGAEAALAAILALLAKHLVCDFALQSGWMARNKGRYLHPAGLAHAGLHAAATLPILLAFGAAPMLALGLAAAECALHYHIDWAKAGITARAGWTTGDRAYWVAFGTDQFLHQVTYLGLILALP